MTCLIVDASALQYSIPNWVRNNAKWWGTGQIGDADFIHAIQYLIENKIIVIPQEQSSVSSNQQIPNWVRNNAKWWGTGQIGDADFIHGLQYLIQVGIIDIPNAVQHATMTQPRVLDKFGIVEIYPSISGGMQWFSNWNNGIARTFEYAKDPQDQWFDCAHGSNGPYDTNGDGILKISGKEPRCYVYEPNMTRQWKDVEITTYFMRVSDTSSDNAKYSGMEAVARTDHGTTKKPEESYPCDTRSLGTRMRVDGHIDFEKETVKPHSKPVSNKLFWKDGMPFNQWFGFKAIYYDLPNGNVVSEEWFDRTVGANGGNWILINRFVDNGTNYGVGGYTCSIAIDPALPLTNAPDRLGSENHKPNITILFRADYINTDGLWYKSTSVREIVPPKEDVNSPG